MLTGGRKCLNYPHDLEALVFVLFFSVYLKSNCNNPLAPAQAVSVQESTCCFTSSSSSSSSLASQRKSNSLFFFLSLSPSLPFSPGDFYSIAKLDIENLPVLVWMKVEPGLIFDFSSFAQHLERRFLFNVAPINRTRIHKAHQIPGCFCFSFFSRWLFVYECPLNPQYFCNCKFNCSFPSFARCIWGVSSPGACEGGEKGSLREVANLTRKLWA